MPESSYAALVESAKRIPDAKALSFFLSADRLDETHVWTYAELVADITRAANLFRLIGVAADRPAAFVLPNLPETHFTIWGGEAAGAALAINPLLEPTQIANLLRSARASVLVTLAPALNPTTWSGLAAELPSLPDLRTVAFVDMADYIDDERGAAARASIEGATGAGLKVLNLRQATREQPSDRLTSGRAIRADEILSYFCTGGTTGAPKIAVRTHRNEVFDAWASQQATETDDSRRTVLCGLPLFHVNGQLVTGLQPWMRGDHVVLATPEGYRGKNVIACFWEIVDRFRVSMFSGVPTLYAALLEIPIGDNNLSSLKFAACGAAPMPAALIRAFETKTGVAILEGYGLTEGACVSSINPIEGERIAGSIGLPIPYQRMAAVILDGKGRFQRFADRTRSGSSRSTGPMSFQATSIRIATKASYRDRRRTLAQHWRPRPAGFEGLLLLAGRREGAYHSQRPQYRSKIIEDALLIHPAVSLRAAVGSPDEYAGQLPVAYVQLKPGAAVTEADLLEHAARTIPEKAAIPKRIRYRRPCPPRRLESCSSWLWWSARSRKPFAPRRRESEQRSRRSGRPRSANRCSGGRRDE